MSMPPLLRFPATPEMRRRPSYPPASGLRSGQECMVAGLEGAEHQRCRFLAPSASRSSLPHCR